MLFEHVAFPQMDDCLFVQGMIKQQVLGELILENCLCKLLAPETYTYP